MKSLQVMLAATTLALAAAGVQAHGDEDHSQDAIFFICIVLMLVGMTVWEIKSPTTERRGFLPMKTTRGDRLFVGLLSICSPR